MFPFFKKPNVKSIDVNEIDDLLGKIELIDIREDFEVAEGTIDTAKHIPMDNLLDAPEKYLQKDKTYYLLCRSGNRSGNTAVRLQEQGYDVVNVNGGMMNYKGKNRKI